MRELIFVFCILMLLGCKKEEQSLIRYAIPDDPDREMGVDVEFTYVNGVRKTQRVIDGWELEFTGDEESQYQLEVTGGLNFNICAELYVNDVLIDSECYKGNNEHIIVSN